MSQQDISACVVGALEQYFHDLDGEKPAAIYDMVVKSEINHAPSCVAILKAKKYFDKIK